MGEQGCRNRVGYRGLAVWLGLALLSILQPLAAQTAAAPAAATPASPIPGQASLPSDFRGIKLGMGMEEVQALLQKDPLFRYRGPEDVSLLPARNQSLVEAAGTSFVQRAFFQFQDGKLWVIILMLNPDKIDHFSVYSSLRAKYGEPGIMGPREARWEDKSVRISLERPLTLRYMDLPVLQGIQEGSAAKEGIEEIERQDFLNGL
jgi:hypothetical protein